MTQLLQLFIRKKKKNRNPQKHHRCGRMSFVYHSSHLQLTSHQGGLNSKDATRDLVVDGTLQLQKII
jgi:hypothetical protein